MSGIGKGGCSDADVKGNGCVKKKKSEGPYVTRSVGHIWVSGGLEGGKGGEPEGGRTAQPCLKWKVEWAGGDWGPLGPTS